jgi:hypothetical protein
MEGLFENVTRTHDLAEIPDLSIDPELEYSGK